MKKKIKLIVVVVVCIIGVITVKSREKAEVVKTDNEITEAVEVAENVEHDTEIILVGGEIGEYGKEIIYNKGKETEDKEIIYVVPSGQYHVTAKTDYLGGQISINSLDTKTNDDGIEEPADIKMATMVKANETIDIVIEDGYGLDIDINGEFALVEY